MRLIFTSFGSVRMNCASGRMKNKISITRIIVSLGWWKVTYSGCAGPFLLRRETLPASSAVAIINNPSLLPRRTPLAEGKTTHDDLSKYYRNTRLGSERKIFFFLFQYLFCDESISRGGIWIIQIEYKYIPKLLNFRILRCKRCKSKNKADATAIFGSQLKRIFRICL